MTEPVAHAEQRRTYVLDTSVLLSDAMALERFDGHDVVLPLVVLSELEAKRHHGELGYMARAALRYLQGPFAVGRTIGVQAALAKRA